MLSPMTDHEPAPADEDRLVFPSTWRRHLPPRRGDGRKPKLDFGRADAELWRTDLVRGNMRIRERLSAPENRDYRAAGLAFLDGEPTPLGAAVVTLLIKDDHAWRGVRLRALFAAMLEKHGPAFAASTAVEYMDVHTPFLRERHPGVDLLSGWADSGWYWQPVAPVLADIREFLNGLPDGDYEATVGVVARHRGTRVKRFASAVLLPDEPGWLDEACREYGNRDAAAWHPGWIADGVLLPVIRTSEQLRAAGSPVLVDDFVTQANVASLVQAGGADSLPLLQRSVAENLDTRAPMLFGAIAVLPSDDAMAFLLDCLDRGEGRHRYSPTVEAMQAAARFPQRAQRLIATKSADASGRKRDLLAMVARIAQAAAPAPDPETRAVIETLADRDRSLPTAPIESLPQLLVDPPWTAKGTRRKAVVIEGLVPPAIDRVVWADGERERFTDAARAIEDDRGEAAWRSEARSLELREATSNRGLFLLANGPTEIVAPVADRWRAGEPLDHRSDDRLMLALARFETAVSEQIAVAAGFAPDYRRVVLPIANMTAARLMADAFVRLKSMRAIATEWFDRHAADAAVLLVPDALGTDKRARKHAESALAHLVSLHGHDLVRDAAKHYGDETVRAIDTIVDVDPLDPIGVKIRKLPIWATPDQLPQVHLRGRRETLPREAVEHLLTMLSFAAIDRPYAGVDIVAEHCDPESLARFSWALFQLWETLGSPSADGWALTQLAHFADDQVVRDITPLVCAWPGQRQNKRAVTGLEVLGAIGSDVALHALHRIAEKVKFKALKEKATAQIDAIAADLGLSTEQLGDRLVPDFGLDQDATLVLDYGPRQFTVVFDERLNPSVADQAGKSFKTVPKPGVKDDAEMAEPAYQRFAALKKNLRAVAVDQVRRLELAMIEARTWTKDEFERYFIDHALNRHLARRLVWSAEIDGAHTGFRIAEDLSYTDAEDGAFDLPDDVPIRLDHPVLMGERVNDWIEVFGDYEILQPFDQFSRPTMALTAEERETGNLTRFEGTEVEIRRLLGLISQGWDRAKPEDAGVEPGITHALPNGLVVTVALEPGIWTGAATESPEQTISSVIISKGEPCWWFDARKPTRLGDLDPVTASEILARLTRLTA